MPPLPLVVSWSAAPQLVGAMRTMLDKMRCNEMPYLIAVHHEGRKSQFQHYAAGNFLRVNPPGVFPVSYYIFGR